MDGSTGSFGSLGVIITAASAHGRLDHILTHATSSQRYFYVQRILLCIAAVTIIATWLNRRTQRQRLALGMLAMVYGVVLARIDDGLYWSSRAGSEHVQHFLREAEAWRHEPGAPTDVLRLETSNLRVPRVHGVR